MHIFHPRLTFEKLMTAFIVTKKMPELAILGTRNSVGKSWGSFEELFADYHQSDRLVLHPEMKNGYEFVTFAAEANLQDGDVARQSDGEFFS
jgi:hypothetical protein